MRFPKLCLLTTTLLLTACAEHAPPQAAAPKPVKIEVAGSTTPGNTDRFVGTIRAQQRTDLGFETPGRLTAVLVDVGDHVRAGQVLAQLDEAPARWRLVKAQADLEAAAATMSERQTWLRQQEALARDGIISPAALQAAQATQQQAVSQHAASEAALANAKRDLKLTRITAPFDGEVVARLAQPFIDVAPGQPMLQLESGRTLEVVAQLPDAVANQLAPGAEATATNGKDKLAVKLERLSGRSDNGSLVQAIFQIKDASPAVRSGGVVSLELPRKGQHMITLPASAVIPDARNKGANVFIVSEDKLHSRAITTDGKLLADGRVAVAGVRAGEKVVIAGTAALHEGQAVVAQLPQTLQQGARQ